MYPILIANKTYKIELEIIHHQLVIILQLIMEIIIKFN